MKLPNNDATLDELIDFALSFNGYDYAGGLVELGGENGLWDKVIPLLNEDKLDDVSVEDIRACLFWLQRSDRYHQNSSPIEEYQGFVEKLRKKL